MANWANFGNAGDPRSAAWQAQNLANVGVGGQSWRVYAPAAQSFQGFLDELSGTGYVPRSSGGFNVRNIAGSDRMSQHSWGNAIDINAESNPHVKNGGGLQTDLPQNVGELAAKYGLEWGGYWKNPDAMHFEWKGGGAVPITEAPGTTSTPATDPFSLPSLMDPFSLPSLMGMKSQDVQQQYNRPLPFEQGFGGQQFMQGLIGGTLKQDLRAAVFKRVLGLFI